MVSSSEAMSEKAAGTARYPDVLWFSSCLDVGFAAFIIEFPRILIYTVLKPTKIILPGKSRKAK